LSFCYSSGNSTNNAYLHAWTTTAQQCDEELFMLFMLSASNLGRSISFPLVALASEISVSSVPCSSAPLASRYPDAHHVFSMRSA
jgi:hypothetical protein